MPRRTRLFVAAFATVLLIAAVALRPSGGALAAWLDAVGRLGSWGPPLVWAIYVLAALVCLPVSVVSLGVGFIYGLTVGLAIAWVGMLLAAAIGFLLARTLLHRWAQRAVAQRAWMRALDRAVARHALKIVLLIRVSPVLPFAALNYALALTRISLRAFLAATAAGTLPLTLIHVGLGASARSLAAAADSPAAGSTRVLLAILGVVSTLLLAVLLGYLGRRALRQSAAELDDSADHSHSEL